MEIIKIWNNRATESQIASISDRIREGQIAIIPTDTMYAIVGDGLNIKSVEKICKLKGINPDKTNLSIICADISMAAEYSKIDNQAYRLLKDNTPGPFTFLFKCVSKLPRAFKGRKIVGIRIPDCEFDTALAESLGNPLISTSIEYKDADFAINTELIAEAYSGKVDMMVDGDEGSLEVSTIIDCTSSMPEIIRQGKGILE